MRLFLSLILPVVWYKALAWNGHRPFQDPASDMLLSCENDDMAPLTAPFTCSSWPEWEDCNRAFDGSLATSWLAASDAADISNPRSSYLEVSFESPQLITALCFRGGERFVRSSVASPLSESDALPTRPESFLQNEHIDSHLRDSVSVQLEKDDVQADRNEHDRFDASPHRVLRRADSALRVSVGGDIMNGEGSESTFSDFDSIVVRFLMKRDSQTSKATSLLRMESKNPELSSNLLSVDQCEAGFRVSARSFLETGRLTLTVSPSVLEKEQQVVCKADMVQISFNPTRSDMFFNGDPRSTGMMNSARIPVTHAERLQFSRDDSNKKDSSKHDTRIGSSKHERFYNQLLRGGTSSLLQNGSSADDWYRSALRGEARVQEYVAHSLAKNPSLDQKHVLAKNPSLDQMHSDEGEQFGERRALMRIHEIVFLTSRGLAGGSEPRGFVEALCTKKGSLDDSEDPSLATHESYTLQSCWALAVMQNATAYDFDSSNDRCRISQSHSGRWSRDPETSKFGQTSCGLEEENEKSVPVFAGERAVVAPACPGANSFEVTPASHQTYAGVVCCGRASPVTKGDDIRNSRFLSASSSRLVCVGGRP